MSLNYSIIIPVFNASLYLEFAIESVIKQKVKDWELILINDASTDNSLRILEDHQKIDRRLRIIDLKEKKEGFRPLRSRFSLFRSPISEFD